ncbi:MAG: zinc-dependent peptidase [Myxococcales bacterium]|nr:zinc-dependent peptidase [Myxococcales bacterium]
MFGSRRRRRKKLRAQPLPAEARATIERNVPFVSGLPASDRAELEGLVQVFLDEKWFQGCGGLELDDEMRLTIAAQACVLLLRLEVDEVYPGLSSILIYPHAYVAHTRRQGPGGIVIEGREVRLGESWDRGTLVLSWDDVRKGAADLHDGHNVVYHEFAHRLDQQAGGSDGAPDLGASTRYVAWARVLGAEFEHLLADLQRHRHTVIEAYGATNPAEFFAVVTECFFEKPTRLEKKHPELYDQLRAFYRRDPAALERGEDERLG